MGLALGLGLGLGLASRTRAMSVEEALVWDLDSSLGFGVGFEAWARNRVRMHLCVG